MTLLKKYGVEKGFRQFFELSNSCSFSQTTTYLLSELFGYIRAIPVKYFYRWGYFGRSIRLGKNNEFQFKFNKHISDFVDIRDSCRIEGKGKFFIGSNSGIGDYGIVRTSNYVKIGKNVLIGPRIFISDSDHSFEDIEKPIYLQSIKKGEVIIGDDIFIGANVTILQDVTIGDGSIIGAGTVVTKDVPEYSVVIGNPGKVIRSRKSTVTMK